LSKYKYVCEFCGSLNIKKITKGRRRKYCSSVCRRAADTKRLKDGTHGRTMHRGACEKCLICFESEIGGQKYCSSLCFKKRNELPRRYCVVCNKPFPPTSRKTRCCSTACAKIKEGNTKRVYGPGDPRPIISKAVCDGIYKSLKHNGGSKRGRQWESLVDFTKDELVKHLEKQFHSGMNWDNYGKWHIDHKVPIAAHNFKTTRHRDFKRCWSLKNLQPMWAKDNVSKGARLTKPFQPSLLI